MPRPRWPGFSFALHLLRVQGFYFALLQYNPIQAFTACFVPSMKLYCPHRKTAHRALQALFLRFAPFYRRKYQTDTRGYNTVYTTLERITAPGCAPAHTRCQRNAGGCTGQHSLPIIIRYIRAHHTADHASPAGSAPAVCESLASADTLSAVQTRRTC